MIVARPASARARDRGVAHAAAAEHRDRVAEADAARVLRGAEAGHHAAAEQAGGFGPRRRVDLRRLTGRDERLLGERADAERGRELGAVVERHLLRRVVRREAVPRPAAAAGPAFAAHRAPVEDDEVAGRDARDIGPDCFDDARGLVAEQEREVVADATFAVVQVGVADTARLHLDQRFAGTGIGDDDRLDGDGLLGAGCHDATNVLSHAAETTAARTPTRSAGLAAPRSHLQRRQQAALRIAHFGESRRPRGRHRRCPASTSAGSDRSEPEHVPLHRRRRPLHREHAAFGVDVDEPAPRSAARAAGCRGSGRSPPPRRTRPRSVRCSAPNASGSGCASNTTQSGSSITTNPPGLVARDHRCERTLAFADVFEHAARVREVELVRRQRIARDVVHAELELVLVTFEEAVVDIGREHVPVGRDQRGEGARHRTAPGTDLEAVPAGLGTEPAQAADRRLVEQAPRGSGGASAPARPCRPARGSSWSPPTSSLQQSVDQRADDRGDDQHEDQRHVEVGDDEADVHRVGVHDDERRQHDRPGRRSRRASWYRGWLDVRHRPWIPRVRSAVAVRSQNRYRSMTRCIWRMLPSWRGLSQTPSHPGRLHAALDLGEVGIVLLGDRAPVALGPVGVEAALGMLPLRVVGRPLQAPTCPSPTGRDRARTAAHGRAARSRDRSARPGSGTSARLRRSSSGRR